MYRIAVCDDNPGDIAYVTALTEEWSRAENLPVQIMGFPSAEAFLFFYEEEKNTDILLLDVEMGGMSGLDLAKRLRRTGAGLQLIFITGYMDYIAEGYDVDALHYLLKPVTGEKLCSVLQKAAARLKNREKELVLELPDGMVRLPLYEIRYLEVMKNYVTVHAEETYSIKRPLNGLEPELDGSFYRTHRSYLVNLRYVKRITRSEVILKDGTEVPLARGKYDGINQAMIAYF